MTLEAGAGQVPPALRGPRGMAQRTAGWLAGLVTLLALGIPSVAHSYPRPGEVARVDVAERGGRTGEPGFGISVSKNGRFAAFTTFSPLVPMDTNQNEDVYVRDMVTGSIELITRSPEGLPAVGPVHTQHKPPVISANGRYVAFASEATNLVHGDTNLVEDVFVFDRKKGAMEVISVDDRGRQPEAGQMTCGPFTQGACSWAPSISSNGRYVSFTSYAPLVSDDTNEGPDVFVRDRSAGKTIRVSVDSDGNQATTCRVGANLSSVAGILEGGRSCPANARWYSSISANGRFVAFESDSPDLVELDTNGTWDVFVRDMKAQTTERVSLASDGEEARDPESVASSGNILFSYGYGSALLFRPGQTISSDGRYVVFTSLASNLVPNDANRTVFSGGADIFVKDRKTGRTERVSVTSAGKETGRASVAGTVSGTISSNGRFALFHCGSGCPEPSEEDGIDVTAAPFMHDRRTGALVPVPGSYSHLNTGDANISPTGRFVVFSKDQGDDFPPMRTFWRADLGEVLGIGGSEGSTPPAGGPDDRICIEEVCIPPGESVSLAPTSSSATQLLRSETNLTGGAVSYRPTLGDLYVALELEHLARTPALAGATAGIVYGMSFETAGRLYEVRAASTGVGSRGETRAAFALFDCSEGSSCAKKRAIEGGFGTTGDRIVFSLPLDAIGADARARLTRVRAFAVRGTLHEGGLVLDQLRIRGPRDGGPHDR